VSTAIQQTISSCEEKYHRRSLFWNHPKYEQLCFSQCHLRFLYHNRYRQHATVLEPSLTKHSHARSSISRLLPSPRPMSDMRSRLLGGCGQQPWSYLRRLRLDTTDLRPEITYDPARRFFWRSTLTHNVTRASLRRKK
jgi:hypothetical protein